jgi:hypothetical protein
MLDLNGRLFRHIVIVGDLSYNETMRLKLVCKTFYQWILPDLLHEVHLKEVERKRELMNKAQKYNILNRLVATNCLNKLFN